MRWNFELIGGWTCSLWDAIGPSIKEEEARRQETGTEWFSWWAIIVVNHDRSVPQWEQDTMLEVRFHCGPVTVKYLRVK